MNIRRDCIHYHCEHEMGASIDCCSLKGLGKCPCSEDCAEYANRAEVYKMGLETIKSKHTKHMIDERSTIEPEPHWIPCSERLPEDNTVCLVTVDQYYIPSYVNQVDVMIYDSGKWLFYNVDDIDTDKTCLIPIIAWMPLPEPYREGES